MNAIVVEYETRNQTVEGLITLLHSLPFLKVKETAFDSTGEGELKPNSETLKVMKEVRDGKTLKMKDVAELRSYLYA